MKWCNAKKRLADVLNPINRAATPQSLQLPANFRMDHNDLDYNNMDYSTMDSHYVCDLCDISFTRNSDLKRHMESKHGRDRKQGHTCGECGKSFSRKDALRRHQLTCQAIRFKCPRCHRVLKDIASLTRHMGLCPVPTYGMCQEQFVNLDKLREHKKSHRTRKTISDPLAHKLKKSENAKGGSIVVSAWTHLPAEKNCFITDSTIWMIPEPIDPWHLISISKTRSWTPCCVTMPNSFLATIASVRRVPISISHSPFPWNVTGGSMKLIRPSILWLTSITTKASS